MAEQAHKDDRDAVPAFVIRCDLSTLRKSDTGSITASICVELDGYLFPNKAWSDFGVVILAWWLRSLNRLARGDRLAELRFMDGPFLLQLTAVDRNKCSIECMQESLTTTVLGTGEGRILDLLAETERVAAEVLEASVEKRWHTPDLELLREEIDKSVASQRRVM